MTHSIKVPSCVVLPAPTEKIPVPMAEILQKSKEYENDLRSLHNQLSSARRTGDREDAQSLQDDIDAIIVKKRQLECISDLMINYFSNPSLRSSQRSEATRLYADFYENENAHTN